MPATDGWPFGHLPQSSSSAAAQALAAADFTAYSHDPLLARELKRYLLIRKSLGRPVTMHSKSIDAVWHSLILDTRRYRELCDQVFGEYLDHISAHFEREPEFDAIYAELFGEQPPDVWDDETIDHGAAPTSQSGGGWFGDFNCA